MTDWPAWDSKVIWTPGAGEYAIDQASGREAYYGPLGEPGTPSQSAADSAWGVGVYGGWAQPDGRYVFYSPAGYWLEMFLGSLPAAITPVNSAGLQDWAASEGIPADAHNPCATMRTGYGEHYQPPFTCPFYPTPYAGQRAWRDTLAESGFGYENIVTAFQRQLGLSGIYAAVNQSAWCKGCDSGHYPGQLYAAISGATGTPPTSGGPGSAATVPVVGGADSAWDRVRTTITRTIPDSQYGLSLIEGASPSGG